MRDLADEDPLLGDSIVVAEIEETTDDYHRYRQVFTGLVPRELLSAVLQTPGGIGHEVDGTGPHPTSIRGDYRPRFWIRGADSGPDKLEPLVVSWSSASRTVLAPDLGFLMTYGLLPRSIRQGDGFDLHWDDLSVPVNDVVVSRPLSTTNVSGESGAYVRILRDYLQDYATVRGLASVQVYFAQRMGPLTPDIEQLLNGQEYVDFRLRGRRLVIVLPGLDKAPLNPVLVKVWGVRPLLEPGPAPITGSRWDYGALDWPGISAPLADGGPRASYQFGHVYVRDSVLERYEGHPEYEIHPESGTVSFGSQWHVRSSGRIGRNLLFVELKRLYEGNHPETVRHWHAFAVAAPTDVQRLVGQSNVGTRSRRIVYGLADLGEALAALRSQVGGANPPALDFVRLERADLDYRGWWKAAHVEPITRHIPLGLTEDAFLKRCDNLYKLVVEGLAEGRLREILEQIGVQRGELRGLRSLKLLERLVRLADLAKRSGLILVEDAPRLLTRLDDEPSPQPLAPLFALNDLRQLADHRADHHRQKKLTDALEIYGLDLAGSAGGWGGALDTVYDRIGDTLTSAALALQ